MTIVTVAAPDRLLADGGSRFSATAASGPIRPATRSTPRPDDASTRPGPGPGFAPERPERGCWPVTALAPTHPWDSLLGDEVLAHLQAQLASARRLLQIVLEQGVAIRGREIESVVRLAGILGAELERRHRVLGLEA